MNERIKSLLAQAHLDVKEEYGIIDTNRVAEKFAELIIRECAGVGERYANGNYEVYNQIVKHFGVEE